MQSSTYITCAFNKDFYSWNTFSVYSSNIAWSVFENGTLLWHLSLDLISINFPQQNWNLIYFSPRACINCSQISECILVTCVDKFSSYILFHEVCTVWKYFPVLIHSRLQNLLNDSIICCIGDKCLYRKSWVSNCKFSGDCGKSK